MCPSSTSDTWKVSDLVLLSWIVQEPDIIQARLVLKSQKSKSLKKKPSCFQQEPPHVRVQRSRLTWTWTWSDLGKHLYTFLFTSVLVHTLVHLLVHLLVHILGVTGTRWSTVPLWLLIWLISLKWVAMHSLTFSIGDQIVAVSLSFYIVCRSLNWFAFVWLRGTNCAFSPDWLWKMEYVLEWKAFSIFC